MECVGHVLLEACLHMVENKIGSVIFYDTLCRSSVSIVLLFLKDLFYFEDNPTQKIGQTAVAVPHDCIASYFVVTLVAVKPNYKSETKSCILCSLHFSKVSGITYFVYKNIVICDLLRVTEHYCC